MKLTLMLMLIFLLSLLLLLPVAAIALDGKMTFDHSKDADFYTVYLIDVLGFPVELQTGESSPIAISLPDDTTHAAFVMSATNAWGTSIEFSEVVYWSKPVEIEKIILVNYPKSPTNLTIIFE